jgi:hypothetical protein
MLLFDFGGYSAATLAFVAASAMVAGTCLRPCQPGDLAADLLRAPCPCRADQPAAARWRDPLIDQGVIAMSAKATPTRSTSIASI